MVDSQPGERLPTIAAMSLPKMKLPIGIQTFVKLREQGCYYVDKTPMALDMIAQGSYYVLSRPRRFGKSLLLDTQAELFEGNRSLFAGLYADDHWDWGKRYPVIRLSFGGGVLRNRDELDRRIRDLLRQNREALALLRPSAVPETDIGGSFGDSYLIAACAIATGARGIFHHIF